MAVIDAFTFLAMVACGVFALAMAFFKLPELSALFLVGVYYFGVFHIAQVVGGDRGWYRNILSTYLWILLLTIVSFAITYYRYGLMSSGTHVEVSFLDAIYFSVTTWTTLGYGDFAPIVRLRHITSIEAILGYIGLGLWITLISNFIQNMVQNRERVREHNEQLLSSLRQQDRQPGLSRSSEAGDA